MALQREFEVKKDQNDEAGGGTKRRKRKEVFWGIVLIAGAVVMLLNRLGLFEGMRLFEGMSFWQMLLSVLLAAVFLNGIVKKSFGQILFSAAFLIILNDRLLHLEAITPWPVLLAALVMTIGLKLLFPKFRGRLKLNVDWSTSKLPSRAEWAEEAVSYDNFFGSAVKYPSGEITEVYLKNGFGEMKVYFNDCLLKNGTGRVCFGSSFGSLELFVPADWQLVLNVDTAFGEVAEAGRKEPFEGNTLYIDGEVAFGELTVNYVARGNREKLADSVRGEERA